MNTIDMTWGVPDFLAPYWEWVDLKPNIAGLPIGYSMTARESLKELILKFHDKAQNASIEGRTVVVGAGASQVLIAALRALGKRKNTQYAWAEPPHFMRFPIFAEFAGLKWQNDESAVKIATSPNNPDGKTLLSTEEDVLNLSYAWPHYVSKVQKLEHPLVVASLSKATGHAGTRIGWALVKDAELAKDIEQIIEFNTCGTSIEAQVKAEAVLKSELQKKQGVFVHGRAEIRRRWYSIQTMQEHLFLPFQVLNNDGMFLWAKGTCPESIIGVQGSRLGATDEFFRLNVGCSQDKFDAFAKMLWLKYPRSTFGSSPDV